MSDSELYEPPRVARKSTGAAQQIPDQRTTLLTRRQAALAKDKINSLQGLSMESERFMENFDPEMSTREKRKLNRKFGIQKKIPMGALYDDCGVHVNSGLDICDCLQKVCPGCHFPCKKCSSQKCGVECRVYRRFIYDEIEYHGYDFIVKNEYK